MFSLMGIPGGIVFFLGSWLLGGTPPIIAMTGGGLFALAWFALSRLVMLKSR